MSNENNEKILEDIFKEFAESIIKDIQANIDSYEGLSDGALRNDISCEITPDGNGSYDVKIYTVPYWDYAQKGSAPWSGSGNGEFIEQFPEIIRKWVKKRGISEEYVQPIVWSIVKKGSSVNRGERPQRDFLGTAIQDNLEKLSAKWREKVSDILVNGMSKLK